ncbi:hypothetical protein KFK09_023222 [Dendrobium nobile]|uniref:Uncharacterized protein n=1 Tax=Dendrobium nobile TaxID=94219 RepID=A0A8T3AK37_DENNO|nr:hypothetical protein KFK09_023222 [Dendrobium nobile]
MMLGNCIMDGWGFSSHSTDAVPPIKCLLLFMLLLTEYDGCDWATQFATRNYVVHIYTISMDLSTFLVVAC